MFPVKNEVAEAVDGNQPAHIAPLHVLGVDCERCGAILHTLHHFEDKVSVDVLHIVQSPLAARIGGVVATSTAAVAHGVLRQVAVEKVIERGPHGTAYRAVSPCLLLNVPLGIVDVIQTMPAIGEALVEHGFVAGVVLVGGDFHREGVNHLVDADRSRVRQVLRRDRASDSLPCVVDVELTEQEVLKFLEELVNRPMRQSRRPFAIAP